MKIGLCNFSIGDAYKEKVKWTIVNKKSYCKRHGYDFIDDSTVYDDSKPIPWSKIKLLLKYINQYDYLVWIDADILIMNLNIKLESFIEQYSQYDQICGSDFRMTNTGVWFIKNTEFSKLFLQGIWDNVYDPEEDKSERYMNWEQGSFINLIDKNFLDSKSKIKVTSPMEMNSYWFNYYPGHFVLHFAGVRSNELKWLIQDYYPEKLDGIETDEACQKRMEWLAGPVRDYLDTKLKNDKEREKIGITEQFISDFVVKQPNEYLSFQQNYISHFDALIEIMAMSGEPFENNLLDINRSSNILSISRFNSAKYLLQIGLNSCVSILVSLLANQNLIIYCFGEIKFSYTQKCFDYLHNLFPERLKLFPGDLSITLPNFNKQNPSLKFDIVNIDDNNNDMRTTNGNFFHSLGFVDFKNFLIFNHYGDKGLQFLWDGYVKDKHILDVSHKFNKSDKQYIGMYLKL